MNQPVPVVRPTLVRYGVLGWLCSLSMITYIDRVCIKQVSGDIQGDLGLTKEEFGWVFSAFALSYSLLEVPSGWFGDRIGPRKVLARIVVCWSAFTALTGAAWNWLSLVVFRFLFGAGEAGAYPNIARALRNWFPYRQRGQAQGMLWMFGRWGGAIAPLLIGALTSVFGWRGAFFAFGMLGVAWVGGFYWWFRDTPREHPAPNDAERSWIEGGLGESAKPAPLSWAAMLASPTLWFLCLMYYSSNAGWCLFITWDVEYLQGARGLTGMPLRLASGAPLFFGGVACMLGGFLTDNRVRVWGRRWGRTAQGLIAYFLGGVFFLVAVAIDDVWLSVSALCMASFAKDFAMAVSWSTCLDIGHRYSGTVAGFMNMVGNLGTVVSPPLVVWLAGVTGESGERNWNAALYYSALMFFIASFGWAFINPRRVIVYAREDRERLEAEGMLK
ncbi:MAG: MFS transporter [Gemmataceae bacterium]|nr:MFS transporter [Gemmataceae bacterium]